MSMSRSTIQELCDFVQHKPSQTLGNKFFDSRLVVQVDVAHKADKYEPRIFIISKFRIFLLMGKTTSSLKIEKSFHVLTIKAIHVTSEEEVVIHVDDGVHKKKINIKCSIHPAMFLARQCLSAIKHYFPDFGSYLQSSVDVNPATLYSEFSSLPTASPRPCHSFRRTYAALCDFYDQPYREEVSWDVEKIYTANKLKDLKIDDFSHLLPKDLLPIVGVLQYSSYFTGLICDGVRVSSEVIDVVLSVIRKSHNLKKLQLRSCALPKDFVTLLASALHNNQNACLEHLDISRNALDDKKGFTILSSVLPRLTTLRYVNVSECQLTDKSMNLLCTGLYNGMTSCKSGGMQITELILSSNPIKDDISSIINLVSICTSLRVLDLSDTGIHLDKLWNALKFGGLQIEKLLLNGCVLGGKKSEGVQTAKEYFSMVVNLSHISFNNTSMPSDYLKAVLLGLASNQQLQPFRLDLDATCEKGSASVLDACIGGIRCETLSLRDNNLDGDLQGVLQSLMMVTCLRRLDIGGSNMNQLKKNNKQAHIINKILLDVVKLYSEEGCLEELNLSECRLGAYLSVLLNTLGATTTLKSLDISGNEIGNFGARILSKALQVNVSLRSVSIDNNHIGADGFVDLATSMKMNHTLTHFPYPVQDAFDCMQRVERPRAVAALTQIQNCLYRNRTAIGADEANCKRMFAGGVLQQMEKTPDDVVGSIVDSITTFGQEPFPPKMSEIIEEFVSKFQVEGGRLIAENITRTIGGDLNATSRRAEQLAVSRLTEVCTEQVKHVFSEWKWREMCESVESELSRMSIGGSGDACSLGRTSSVGTGSPAMSSPFTPKKAGHRPRSIIGDLTSSTTSSETVGGGGPGEQGIDLDRPPKPSGLSHLQKARPRKRGGAAASSVLNNDDVMNTSKSSGTPDNGDMMEDLIEEVEEQMEKRAPIGGHRMAMIPDTSLLAQVHLRPSADRTLSGTSSDFQLSPREAAASSSPTTAHRVLTSSDSPPPLPQRNRVGPGGAPPPLLPPKPEPRTRLIGIGSPTTPPATAEDDENANSRRSVADMAKIFQK
ncbi:CBN-CRML-1 protein [Caenorhabditis brenneri]|uniref:CBN-CRML-1 protein n=1 Tax=Caenorhabditis brenneri TaxID=135651 RepID=G0PB35_CAEBE|nr:CBN-CRML-1 protein [Caenorhabditis brenneri]